MTRRLEFTSQTKREAYKRSGGVCECHRIPWLTVCGQPLSTGNIFYEHINPDAIRQDNSLDNAAALTKTCWRIKTDQYDRKIIAKNNHSRDRHINAKARPYNPIAGGRHDRIKKKMDGTVIVRATGERA